MSASFRIPKKLDYPGGYTVKIVVVPRAQIVGESHGEFDDDTRTILVAQELSPPEKRWVFLHEKRHADADYEQWFGQHFSIRVPEGAEVDPLEVEEPPSD